MPAGARDRTVLVVGCGGLGGPAALALSAAGCPLVLCDPDRVELSNLHRQVHFGPDDLGEGKAERLRALLLARGVPADRITFRDAPFRHGDALPPGCCGLFDGSDNFATKFAVSDAAVAAGIPAVIASALRLEGQIASVWPGGPCYRCLFEDEPAGDDTESCTAAGVLGPVLAAVAGRAVSQLLRMLDGRAPDAPLLTLSDIPAPPREVLYRQRPGCPACNAAPGYHGAVARRSPRDLGPNHREV